MEASAMPPFSTEPVSCAPRSHCEAVSGAVMGFPNSHYLFNTSPPLPDWFLSRTPGSGVRAAPRTNVSSALLALPCGPMAGAANLPHVRDEEWPLLSTHCWPCGRLVYSVPDTDLLSTPSPSALKLPVTSFPGM